MFRFLRTKHYHNVIHWYEASLSRGKPSSQPKQKPHMMVFTLCNLHGHDDQNFIPSASNDFLCERPDKHSSRAGVLHQPGFVIFIMLMVVLVMVVRMVNDQPKQGEMLSKQFSSSAQFWLIESKDVEAPFFHDEGWDAEPGDLVRIDRCQLDGSAICPWTRALCGTHFKPTGIYHNHGGKSMKKEGTLRKKLCSSDWIIPLPSAY